MEQLGGMKLYSLEEVKDELIGKVGTPERDDFDRKVEESPHRGSYKKCAYKAESHAGRTW